MHKVEKKLKADGKVQDLHDLLSWICMIDLVFIEQAYVKANSAVLLQETGWTEGL